MREISNPLPTSCTGCTGLKNKIQNRVQHLRFPSTTSLSPILHHPQPIHPSPQIRASFTCKPVPASSPFSFTSHQRCITHSHSPTQPAPPVLCLLSPPNHLDTTSTSHHSSKQSKPLSSIPSLQRISTTPTTARITTVPQPRPPHLFPSVLSQHLLTQPSTPPRQRNHHSPPFLFFPSSIPLHSFPFDSTNLLFPRSQPRRTFNTCFPSPPILLPPFTVIAHISPLQLLFSAIPLSRSTFPPPFTTTALPQFSYLPPTSSTPLFSSAWHSLSPAFTEKHYLQSLGRVLKFQIFFQTVYYLWKKS